MRAARHLAVSGPAMIMVLAAALLTLVVLAVTGAPGASAARSAAAPADALSRVSCPTPTFCMAVGRSHVNRLGVGRSLAEAWNGRTWRVTRTPSPGQAGSGLSGVSCLSPTRCLAVGSLGTGQQLTAAWNGRTWRALKAPRNGSALQAVACTSATRCMAVGAGHICETAEQWNGSTWRVLVTPSPCGPPGSGGLSGVACLRAARCFAVGTYAPDNETQLSLAEAWNGRSWRQLGTASPGDLADLSGVSCPAVGHCVAVGYALPDEALGLAAMAPAWNGHAWKLMTVATPGAPASLSDVSCVRATHCLAVGFRTGTSKAEFPLAQLWNGRTWKTITRMPATSGGLTGISCPRTDRCVAVGETAAQRTFAATWNGRSWHVSKTPSP